MGTSYEDDYTLVITSRSVLIRMKNVSDKLCKATRNTHILCSITLNRAVYEVMGKIL